MIATLLLTDGRYRTCRRRCRRGMLARDSAMVSSRRYGVANRVGVSRRVASREPIGAAPEIGVTNASQNCPQARSPARLRLDLGVGRVAIATSTASGDASDRGRSARSRDCFDTEDQPRHRVKHSSRCPPAPRKLSLNDDDEPTEVTHE